MSTQLDSAGQPVNIYFNAERREDRDISEMVGLVKGVLVDGEITDTEPKALNDWILAHPDVTSVWPGNRLAERLQQIFEDGRVSREERSDLLQLLTSLVGGKAGVIAGKNAATTLPLDRPQPRIKFADHTFVLTGQFAFGPRQACEQFVVKAGGSCEKGITKRTDYLVIGTFASRDWIQTSHGRKIEKAVAYKKKGIPISIVGEDHWAASLPK